MALTPSRMMPLGTPAPDFNLPDTVTGDTLSLSKIRGDKATVLMFICNHCPYVKHVELELIRLGRDYKDRGVGFAAISSNDAQNYPEDAPDKMQATAKARGYSFPYLYDETQQVARAYGAECTPDFFVFDAGLKCVYRGQLDESRPSNDEPNDGHCMRTALDALISGDAVPQDQKPSVGCDIKWR